MCSFYSWVIFLLVAALGQCTFNWIIYTFRFKHTILSSIYQVVLCVIFFFLFLLGQMCLLTKLACVHVCVSMSVHGQVCMSVSLLRIYAAAAAKLLQSCQTLCDPMDGSPPGPPVPGILQARTLEWVAISLSSVWKWKVKEVTQSGLTLSDPMDCSLPDSSVHGIFQARILEWVAIAFSSSGSICIFNLTQSVFEWYYTL